MPKKHFLLLLLVILALSHAGSLFGFAQEAQTYQESNTTWPLPRKTIENLLDITRKWPLTEAQRDLFYQSLSNPDSSFPRKTGAVGLVKQIILKEQLNYWLKTVPLELSIKFIKTVFKLIPLIYNKEISTVIEMIETYTVEKATEYATDWFLQNEIKIGSGEGNYAFLSYKKNRQEINIPYLIAYHPLSATKGKIVVEFYSTNPLEPPLGTGAFGSLGSNKDHIGIMPWPWDIWLDNEEKRDNDGKLEPFIVRVKGYIKRDKWNNFRWDKTSKKPTVEVDFDSPVPEIDQSDIVWKSEKTMKYDFIKRKFLGPAGEKLESIKETIECLINSIKSAPGGLMEQLFEIKEKTGNFLNKIASYFQKTEPETQLAALKPEQLGETQSDLFLDPNPPQQEIEELKIEITTQSNQQQNGQLEGKKENSQEIDISEESTSPIKKTDKETEPTLAELIEEFDEISEMAEEVIVQGQELLAKEGIFPEQDGEENKETPETDLGETETKEAEETQPEQENTPEEGPGPILEEEITPCSVSNNQNPVRNIIIFNEIAWMGGINSSSDEWFELKNISETPVNLNGWQILDKAAIEGNSQAIKIVLNNSILNSSAFFLAERTDDDSVPNIPADFIYTGSLGNSNETLYLFNKNCELQDKAVSSPDWPAGDKDSKRTLERKPDLTWQTSSNIGGTPRAENSSGYIPYIPPGGAPSPPPEEPERPSEQLSEETTSSTEILITEIQIAAAKSSNHDFIELFNPTTNIIDISGFQLKKKTATGKEYSIRILPEESILLSKSYFLWTNSSYASSTQIPANSTSTQTLAKNNSIALLDKNKSIIDAVAWGTSTNPFVETVPFPENPDENRNLGRKIDNNQNYIDTNDNSQDFELQNPTPKEKNQIPEAEINQLPVANFSYSPINPQVNQEIIFNAASSSDPDGEIIEYTWNFGDGNSTTNDQDTAVHSFTSSNEFQITLVVVDNQSATSSPATTSIKVEEKILLKAAENVVVSEIQLKNKEFVELFNPTDQPVSTQGWHLSYFSSAKTWSSPQRNWEFPTTSTIPAKSYYLIGIHDYPTEGGHPDSDWQVVGKNHRNTIRHRPIK